MNALARWKIVLALIATFAAGAVTSGLLTKRVIKQAVRSLAPPCSSSPIPTISTMDALQRELRLKPEQTEKVNPILRQMANEFDNLHVLDLRETEGILSRGQDRMNPILEPDQRTRMQQIIEERGQRAREWINVSEPPASPN
jgi:hypothetical protein